jgi:hypothetical protein
MIPNWFQSLAVSTPRGIELQNETAFLLRHCERAKTFVENYLDQPLAILPDI